MLYDESEIAIFSPQDQKEFITTIKTYQTIYNQITGKKQKIEKKLKLIYELKFGEIDQLNLKIEQLLKQYHIISKNCTINIFHENDDNEVFDSYDKFSTYNISNIHPIIAIAMTWNFSMLCQSDKKIKNYSINVNITPGNTPPKELDDRFRFLTFAGPTILISIEYVDYVIARIFIENITDWAKGIEKYKKSKTLLYVQKRSEFTNIIIKIIGFGLLLYIVFKYSHNIVPEIVSNSNHVFTNIIIVVVISLLLNFILDTLGRKIEYNIDTIGHIACIIINKGDEQLKGKIDKKRNKNTTNIVIGFILSLIASISGSVIVYFIFR